MAPVPFRVLSVDMRICRLGKVVEGEVEGEEGGRRGFFFVLEEERERERDKAS